LRSIRSWRYSASEIRRFAQGWFLPVAGGLLFALLIGAVMTSAVWFIGARGWPG
jgi:hypothetical protein